MAFFVNKKMCATCIFSKNSPISEERFKDLEETWEKEGKQQECHQFTKKNEHAACRGHYEAAKRGEYQNYPVVSAVSQIFNANLNAEQAFQIGERLGYIVFIGEDDE